MAASLINHLTLPTGSWNPLLPDSPSFVLCCVSNILLCLLYTLYSLYSALYTILSILCSLYSALYTLLSILCMHCLLAILQFLSQLETQKRFITHSSELNHPWRQRKFARKCTALLPTQILLGVVVVIVVVVLVAVVCSSYSSVVVVVAVVI